MLSDFLAQRTRTGHSWCTMKWKFTGNVLFLVRSEIKGWACICCTLLDCYHEACVLHLDNAKLVTFKQLFRDDELICLDGSCI